MGNIGRFRYMFYCYDINTEHNLQRMGNSIVSESFRSKITWKRLYLILNIYILKLFLFCTVALADTRTDPITAGYSSGGSTSSRTPSGGSSSTSRIAYSKRRGSGGGGGGGGGGSRGGGGVYI